WQPYPLNSARSIIALAPPRACLSQPLERTLPPDISSDTVALLKWGLLLETDTSFPINSTIKPCSSFFCNSLSIAHPHKPENLIAREALRKQHEQLLRLSSASSEYQA